MSFPASSVRIALDDFGAGASSFGYLKTLKVDLLKIDGSFIKDLIDDPLDAAAVRCFVDVARVLGGQTVAEFVDRPEVLARARHRHRLRARLLPAPARADQQPVGRRHPTGERAIAEYARTKSTLIP